MCLYLVRDSILFTPLVREFISDYSLMVSVLVASFFGSFVFQNTELRLFFSFSFQKYNMIRTNSDHNDKQFYSLTNKLLDKKM